MYGTVARMTLKPGGEADLMRLSQAQPADIPGMVFTHVYKLDSGANEYMMVVGFKDKEAYTANANNPRTHQQYLEYVKFMAAEPEWNDGEIIQSSTWA